MRRQHWDEFWKQGFITTFGDSLRNNYQGQVREFWEKVFSTANPNSRVLDVATGNGALACIAAAISKQHHLSLEILAADAAEIPASIDAPKEIMELRESIQFFSNMPCESLAFPADHFNLITSQYGIEYGRWDQSIPEVFRTLSQKGVADFLCHRDRAIVVKKSVAEITIYRSALQKYRIFDAAERFTQAYGKTGSSNPQEAKALNKDINDFKEAHQGQQLCHVLVSDIAGQLKRLRTVDTTQVVAALRERKSEYSAAMARLEDMADAALSDSDIESIVNLATRSGFKDVTTRDIYQSGELIGVHIHLVK
ncbi:Ubiquinone/menaquinone biosynthesis C-methyltransferase UbiE [Microbulbifer aggregans]|uniref:Ubiquinone/menaquinone biosynthesis C-methyltransferase UbiE n=1 Tax=Microbulbifer aggregans TaxID=1769779 RepID=A0A1C9W376_9GAMM|nr:class I SAM-dependent methyltransferase [Microbulbifer aggregans]AOS95608.1 Ubiquinone/menaquinone biosynthesis C-methyltransferase UbiE [Microbulbifer aggregans]